MEQREVSQHTMYNITRLRILDSVYPDQSQSPPRRRQHKVNIHTTKTTGRKTERNKKPRIHTKENKQKRKRTPITPKLKEKKEMKRKVDHEKKYNANPIIPPAQSTPRHINPAPKKKTISKKKASQDSIQGHFILKTSSLHPSIQRPTQTNTISTLSTPAIPTTAHSFSQNKTPSSQPLNIKPFYAARVFTLLLVLLRSSVSSGAATSSDGTRRVPLTFPLALPGVSVVA
ncbi:hypothetical protein K440DRAFT_284347 [Wilcoxina mikolae CBS 423.85]|nr:hypothetical protein K440DRAFT_284347 [Wilcoxina mikolae CBS 423.85]